MPIGSKPWIIGPGITDREAEEIDQMFRELYDAVAELDSEVSTGSTGSGSSSLTIAQVMARVVIGI